MIKRFTVLLCCLLAPGLAQAVSVADYPYLGAIVDRLVAQHGLNRQDLIHTFDKVTLRPEVVAAMKRPAERLPWYRYRPIFVNPGQVRNGVRFWSDNEKVLARAARDTGVPPQIIVAVIGIETRYGTSLGSHPVLDSLTTLTVEYPRRRKFFGKQLEQFLLLTHEQSLDRFSIMGSYAGAFGIPQFMPSSYREYAVDYSGDGKADLVNETADAIGSVANYLKQAKWQPGQPVCIRVRPKVKPAPALLDGAHKLKTTVGRLRASGYDIDASIGDDVKAGVIALDEEKGSSYWVVFENFYVITRYNPSIEYAMAVHELSTTLKREYRGS
jgi:membrane-bound lytic murein transglycosylase B